MSGLEEKGLNKRFCAASDCFVVFVPTKSHQKYCCVKCADREKKRIQRKLREKRGLCKYCGGPMDNNPMEVSYCSKCVQYFSKNHAKKVAKNKESRL